MSALPPRSLLCLALLLTLAFAACGGEGESSTTMQSPAAAPSQAAPPPQPLPTSAAAVREFGEAASPAQLQAAARALEGFLAARERRDWPEVCEALSTGFVEVLRGVTRSSKDCPQLLAALAKRSPALTDPPGAKVSGLRVEGDRAYLIYRGEGGADYAIAVSEEGGAWRFSTFAGRHLTSGS